MKANLMFFLGLLTLFLAGCVKEGPVGPKGDTGATGAQGPAGAQGAPGQNGAPGQTDAVVSTFDIYPSDWVHYGTNGNSDDRYVFSKSITSITSDIFEKGLVLCYYRWQGSGAYFPLPVTIYQSSSYQIFYTASHYVGGVSIQRYDSDYNTVAPSSVMQIKVLTVPGHYRAAHPTINWNDYVQVAEVLEITE